MLVVSAAVENGVAVPLVGGLALIDPDTVGVPDPIGVPDPDTVSVLDNDTIGVTHPDTVGVNEVVVGDSEEVPLGVTVVVGVGVGVPDVVDEGVGDSEGNRIPFTNKGPANMVPALDTLFQAFVVKVPAVAPVHTLVRDRMP